MKVVKKYFALIAAITLSLALGLVLVVLNLQAMGQSEMHGAQKDFSARQSMLAQRMQRNLQELSGATPGSPAQRRSLKQLDADAAEFDRALRVLDQGYTGPNRLGDRVELSPLARDTQAADLLRSRRTLWDTYFPLLETLGPTVVPSAKEIAAASAYATEHTDRLHDLMDRLTLHLTRHNQADLQFMRSLQIVLGGLLIAIVVMKFWVLARIRRAEVREQGHLQDAASALDAQLNQAQEQLRDLMVVSPDLVWTKDASGAYQMCNQAYLEFTARVATDLVGRSDLDLYEAQQSDLERARDAKLMAQGQSTHAEARLTSVRSGAAGLYEVVRTPLFLGDGRPAGVQTVARDITLRREAEQALAASRQRLLLFEKCFDNLNDAILITEAEPRSEPGPRIVYANKAFEQMTGFSAQEVLGRNPRMLQGPKTDRRETARMHDALFAWRSERMEVINYAKNGREFWAEIAVTPIADGSNADWFTHWVAVQRDVTERKRNEHMMRDLFERATESSRLKSNFLASVSHEIRTPMNGILGITQLLGDTALNEEQREYVSMIRHSADALMVIVNDILDLSKIESGQLRVESQLFELGPVIDAVAALMNKVAQTKNLVFRVSKAPNTPGFMHTDAGRLRQILLNLVGNGIKFTPSGSVELVVGATQDAAGQPLVRFEVRDSGIGIPSAQQHLLFQPFRQLDGSNTRKYGSTGLGLAISRQLVERMHGRIGVESTPDVGSMFWFELPIAGTPDPAKQDA